MAIFYKFLGVKGNYDFRNEKQNFVNIFGKF